MNKLKIKICGLKNIQTIDHCINKGVNYFGLIFYKKSPRYVNIDLALKLLNHTKYKNISAVGVFVDEPISNLKDIIIKTNLNYIQLHGKEDNEYIKNLKNNFDLKIIKCLKIENKNDLKKMNEFTNADYYLFDYKSEKHELPGGNAKSFNWSLIKGEKINKPWFISGGININNIEEIRKKLSPYGIDISSGVEEKPGIKSMNKISKLIEKLNV